MTDRIATATLQGVPRLPLPYADAQLTHLGLQGGLDRLGMPDLMKVLHEARRVLSPGGILEWTGDDASYDSAHRALTLLGLISVSASTHSGGPTGQCWEKPQRRPSAPPTVTVAIPAYSPQFFEATLASAQAQTYPHLDILVCDDSPDDQIARIVERRVALCASPPLRYVRNTERLRGRGNYRQCLEAARGEYIKYLNDDDVLHPDCVAHLVAAFSRAPNVVLATSARRLIDGNDAVLDDIPATRPLASGDTLFQGTSLLNAMLMAGLNVVGEPSTTLFRRADLLGGLPDPFCFAGVYGYGVIDMSMWSTLMLKGDVAYLSDRLSHFRWHADQRQHEAASRARSVDGIRALQSAWMGLGLHRHFDRSRLVARPLGAPSAVPVPA